MLTLFGGMQRFCDNFTRRSFLKIGALGAGLNLADLLRLRAVGRPAAASPRKAAIMIYLPGGPPHIDMYDLKPNAPVEFRGEFRHIKTNVPGVDICELMPLQARMWDKLAVIRSLVTASEHSDSEVMTGYTEAVNRVARHPSIGSVISKLRGSPNGVPPFASLIYNPNRPGSISIGHEPGYLGVGHRPFLPDGQSLENLRLPSGVGMDQLGDRRRLLAGFDSVRRDIDRSGAMEGLDSFYARAFEMVVSDTVHKALDLSREEPRSRDRYRGVEQFLTARRLIEAGAGFVTLTYGSWDLHSGNFTKLRPMLPELDRAISNLVQDLYDRGMDKDVVTIAWGEFGRSPKIGYGGDGKDGRNHWPLMSAVVAGGGLKMGQAVGSTSARAEYAKDKPYSVQQVLSTIYRALGIDPATTFPDASGRPMYLLDDRNPVTELL